MLLDARARRRVKGTAGQTESNKWLSQGNSSPQLRPEAAVFNTDGLQLMSWKHSAPSAVSINVQAWFSGMRSLRNPRCADEQQRLQLGFRKS